MELLSPAGSLEKLATAYRYGADAAYIGVHGFSLRTHADAIPGEDPEALAADLRRLKAGGRKLYAALNLFAHQDDLRRVPDVLSRLAVLPIDAVILADIGLIDAVNRAMPGVELHLSTQANCTNAAAARVYHRLGFSRIVPSRELSLDEVRAIKDAVPGLEVEVFVHGAMCMAYSGRCFLSDELAGRSANRGDCAQSCRWKYRVEQYRLEERQRPGRFIPVESDGRFTTILSSRDLNLFDHIPELMEAGVDAVKIEGRMKSSLYVAAVTRSYRAAIDACAGADVASGTPVGDLDAHRQELFRIAHREYTAGFLFGDGTVHEPAEGDTPGDHRLMAVVDDRAPHLGPDAWRLTVKNTIHAGTTIEYLPQNPASPTRVTDRSFTLLTPDGAPTDRVTNADHGAIVPSPEVAHSLAAGTVIRAARRA